MLNQNKILFVLCCLGLGAGAYFILGSDSYEIRNVPAPRGPIVAFGDSLTEGFGAGRGEAYPARLAELLGRPVLNRGVGGDTTVEGLGRLRRDVLELKPGIVLVCLGGNDMLRLTDSAKALERLDKIVEQIQATGAVVVLVGVRGVSLLTREYGKGYRELARRRGCVFVPDMLDGLFGDNATMSDQIHPNAAGYAIIAQRMAETLAPYL